MYLPVNVPPRPISDFSDEELVREATVLDTALLPPTQFEGLGEKPKLTEWEKSFLAGIQTSWIQFGTLTWKQRRSLRQILQNVRERQERLLDLQKIRLDTASR